MFDQPLTSAATASGARLPYRGPERRGGGAQTWRWLAAALDEVDYGVLVVDDEARLLHANHAARAELDADHPLQLLGARLRTQHLRDVALLHGALEGAQRGLRRLLTLGEAPQQVAVSVVPLGPLGADSRQATLVMLGRRQVCGELAIEGFARSHGLTPGETRVLIALCQGAGPAEAAQRNGVAISTVRSQIGAIRTKTGAASIRELVQLVAALPPLMGVLRGLASHAAARLAV